MDAFRSAYVYVRDCFAGTLCETDEGYSFTYDQAYLHSEHPAHVSLTLPLREQPYESTSLFPFFDGLVPEGWLLNVVSKNWKVNSNDRFGILLIACHDAIGAVSIQKEKV